MRGRIRTRPGGELGLRSRPPRRRARVRACARSARSRARAAIPTGRGCRSRTSRRSSAGRSGTAGGRRATSSRCRSRRRRAARRGRCSRRRPTVAAAGSFISAPSVISRISRAGRGRHSLEQRLDPVGELRVEELARRDVHADRRRGRRADVSIHRAGFRHAVDQHVLADLVDEAGLLGERDERQRAERTALRVLPADERLERGDARPTAARRSAGSAPSARRVRPRRGDALRGRAVRRRRGASRVAKTRAAVLAARLGRVHREVGVAEHLVGAGARRSVRDADARGRRDAQARRARPAPAARR